MMSLPDSRKAIFRGAEQRSWDQLFLPLPKAHPLKHQNMHDSQRRKFDFQGGRRKGGQWEKVRVVDCTIGYY